MCDDYHLTKQGTGHIDIININNLSLLSSGLLEVNVVQLAPHLLQLLL